MDERIYELDSHGDITFLLYDVPKSLPEILDQLHPWTLDGSEQHLTPEEKEEETNQKPQSVLKIRASSKHLTLSSPQFTRTLHSGFQESHDLQKTGHLELKIENWDPAAFLVLMLILHGRTRLVPIEMTISKLADFAVLVDYYECYEAVEVFTDMWIKELRVWGRWSPKSVVQAEEALFIAWVFQHRLMFQRACAYLRGNLTGRFCSELPIPRRVCGMFYQSLVRAGQGLMQLDAIERAREDAIGMGQAA